MLLSARPPCAPQAPEHRPRQDQVEGPLLPALRLADADAAAVAIAGGRGRGRRDSDRVLRPGRQWRGLDRTGCRLHPSDHASICVDAHEDEILPPEWTGRHSMVAVFMMPHRSWTTAVAPI